MEQFFRGNCLDILPRLEGESVQCCVTSPPYWGLRDNGTAEWEGGSDECHHLDQSCGMSDKNTLGPNGYLPQSNAANIGRKMHFRDICGKCGARRIDSQLGLEATPEEYIVNMIRVFREVWRVLRADGTLWLNLGDSYASGEIGRHDQKAGCYLTGWTAKKGNGEMRQQAKLNSGLKPKDLVGIPWRVAFALQADGWYLRSDIIWHKPNPMPESVTDRPTKSHEYIFLLTKQERYFYDAEAIKEKGSDFLNGRESRYYTNPKQSNGDFGVKPGDISGSEIREYRNKRSVWTIPTQAYAEAHFATFPEEIPKLCILAGSKPGDIVLDPFAGSGTVGKVALELGRTPILIELNPAYETFILDRTNVTKGWF